MSRPKEREQDILKAAAEVFGLRGFHEASIGDIADAAQIGKGTVYEYFSSKNALLLAVMDDSFTRYYAELNASLTRGQGFKDQLSVFIRHNQEIIRHNLKMADMMLRCDGGGLNGEMKVLVHEKILDLRSKVVRRLQDIFEQGRAEGFIGDADLEFASDLFLNMVVRFAMRSVGYSDIAEDSSQEQEKLIALLLNGIGTGQRG
jgi:TetR/AcrR family fatty acid metabolism transcriptional regulator